MKCQHNRCYSPIACDAFGYCRIRNYDLHGQLPTDEIKVKWQTEDQCPKGTENANIKWNED